MEKLIEDFRTGRKDKESFWIRLGDKYVLIQYFAVRDEEGNFMGTLEVTMDIKPLQAITGEKRIMDN
ncbi:MAG: PAS domain-containing protein [Thermanaeromonas sp.]|nr:PAS domain-containing protein [Thermanaeromonas sp.]MCG0278094.1 PAS domain-containing protein [Thermanaeromonas sp.]